MSLKILITCAAEDDAYLKRLQSYGSTATDTKWVILPGQPCAGPQWRDQCRDAVRKSDGLVVLLSKNTMRCPQARYAIYCAIEEKRPVAGMYVHAVLKGTHPPELPTSRVFELCPTAMEAFRAELMRSKPWYQRLF
jgi:hypothetical protein